MLQLASNTHTYEQIHEQTVFAQLAWVFKAMVIYSQLHLIHNMLNSSLLLIQTYRLQQITMYTIDSLC